MRVYWRYGKRSRCCARLGESLDLRLRIQDAVDKINVDRHQLRCQCEIKAKVKDNVIVVDRRSDILYEQPLVSIAPFQVQLEGAPS